MAEAIWNSPDINNSGASVEQSMARSRLPAVSPAVSPDAAAREEAIKKRIADRNASLVAARGNPALVSQVNAQLAAQKSRLPALRPGEDVSFNPAPAAANGTIRFDNAAGQSVAVAGGMSGQDTSKAVQDAMVAKTMPKSLPNGLPLDYPKDGPFYNMGPGQLYDVLKQNWKLAPLGYMPPTSALAGGSTSSNAGTSAAKPEVPSTNDLFSRLGELASTTPAPKGDGVVEDPFNESFLGKRLPGVAYKDGQWVLPDKPKNLPASSAGAAIETVVKAEAHKAAGDAATKKAEAQKVSSAAKAQEHEAKASMTERVHQSQIALNESKVRTSWLQGLFKQAQDAQERTPTAVSGRLQDLLSGRAKRGPRGK